MPTCFCGLSYEVKGWPKPFDDFYAQLLSFLRDYDVLWPAATITLFSYSDSFNLGISVTAPECYIKGYTFFTFYIATMAMPVRRFAKLVS